MKKLIFLFALTIGVLSTVISQNLSLSNLESICSKSNWEDVNNYLESKGWEYYTSRKGEKDFFNSITWSFEKNRYDNKAQSWLYLYTYKGEPGKVGISIFSKAVIQRIKKAIKAKGYKRIESNIEENSTQIIYQNSRYLLQIRTSMKENDYDVFTTTYYVNIIRKGGIFDIDNGKKILYWENGNISETFTLRNGRYEGVYMSYYKSGNIKTIINYSNDLINGNKKIYNDDGEIVNDGLYINGRRNGISLVYENGLVKQELQYINDTLNGIAKVYYYNDSNSIVTVYTGEIVNGKMEGKWVINSATHPENNPLQYWNFKYGEKNGEALEIDKDTIIKCNYKNDLLDGPYSKYVLQEIIDLNDSLGYHENSKKQILWKKGTYLKGMKNGKWIITDHLFGYKSAEGLYVNDLKEGRWIGFFTLFGPVGDTAYIKTYKGGLLNGKSIYYSKKQSFNRDSINNTIGFTPEKCRIIYTYSNGELNGIYAEDDSLGNHIVQGYYENDKKHGQWIYFNSTNQIVLKEQYKKGSILSQHFYSENQKLIKELIIQLNNTSSNSINLGFLIIQTEYLDNDTIEVTTYKTSKQEVYQKTEDLLKAYVTTSNNEKYKTIEEVNTKFPEFKDYDTELLADYIATANSEKYKSWDIINSKFPELFNNIPYSIELFNSIKTRNGKYTLTIGSNKVIEGEYSNDKKTSKWKYYYPSQNVLVVRTFKTDSLISEEYQTIEPKKSFSGTFVLQRKEGKEVIKVKNGLRHGKTIFYAKSGEKIKTIKYKAGVKI